MTTCQPGVAPSHNTVRDAICSDVIDDIRDVRLSEVGGGGIFQNSPPLDRLMILSQSLTRENKKETKNKRTF